MTHRRKSRPFTPDEIRALIAAARTDPAHLAPVLVIYRPYLLAIAWRELDTQLQPKLSASDLVQETLMEAQQGFGQFAGGSEVELRLWLRTVLLHNLADARNRYLTEMRQIGRERPLEGAESDEFLTLASIAKGDAPSEALRTKESAEQVHAAIALLPTNQREIIRLRHLEEHSFAEIGTRLGISEKAARMLHLRALDRLTQIHDRESPSGA